MPTSKELRKYAIERTKYHVIDLGGGCIHLSSLLNSAQELFDKGLKPEEILLDADAGHNNVELMLTARIPKTDEELDKEIKLVKERRLKNEERDRKQYEMLRKRFEDTGEVGRRRD